MAADYWWSSDDRLKTAGLKTTVVSTCLSSVSGSSNVSNLPERNSNLLASPGGQ